MARKALSTFSKAACLGAALSVVSFAAIADTATAPTPAAAPAASSKPSPQEILDTSPATAWKNIPADDIVVMKLADGTSVTLQLASAFAPVHAANVRQLVRSHYFDGAVILRVQDDYVTQWGRTDDDPTKPQGIVALPPAEYDFPAKGVKFKPLPYRDAYALHVGYIDGWPAASDGKRDWLIHCYGMVGVARNNPPDTGDSTQLYTVIGHAPRHLDRNLTLVARVIDGQDTLAARPRGTDTLGFYKTDAERTKIVSAQMASDMTAGAPAYQSLDTSSPTFDTWLKEKASRSQAFFVRPANAIDICNAEAPVRAKP